MVSIMQRRIWIAFRGSVFSNSLWLKDIIKYELETFLKVSTHHTHERARARRMAGYGSTIVPPPPPTTTI